jgi:hypothetical protein
MNLPELTPLASPENIESARSRNVALCNRLPRLDSRRCAVTDRIAAAAQITCMKGCCACAANRSCSRQETNASLPTRIRLA